MKEKFLGKIKTKISDEALFELLNDKDSRFDFNFEIEILDIDEEKKINTCFLSSDNIELIDVKNEYKINFTYEQKKLIKIDSIERIK